MDIHGKRHHRPFALPFPFSPGDDGREISPRIENVHIEALIFDPGQTGNVKGIRRDLRQIERPQTLKALSVREKTRVEVKEVVAVLGHEFCATLRPPRGNARNREKRNPTSPPRRFAVPAEIPRGN